MAAKHYSPIAHRMYDAHPTPSHLTDRDTPGPNKCVYKVRWKFLLLRVAKRSFRVLLLVQLKREKKFFFRFLASGKMKVWQFSQIGAHSHTCISTKLFFSDVNHMQYIQKCSQSNTHTLCNNVIEKSNFKKTLFLPLSKASLALLFSFSRRCGSCAWAHSYFFAAYCTTNAFFIGIKWW